MIKKQREQYEAPSTNVILLRMETGILTISGDGDPADWSSGQNNWWNDPDFGV